MKRNRFFTLLLSATIPFVIDSCTPGDRFMPATIISVEGDKWYVNNEIINRGSPAEGLLMNVRMVNSVFEDTGDKIPSEFREFDPGLNTAEFVSMIPEYVSYGVNAFTVSLQGGMPGYEGAVNSAFEPDGSLKEGYMQRVAKVIKAADSSKAAVILSCFYQRQHSNPSALNGRDAILNAVDNTVKWIKINGFRNVILEISNEYRHGGYRNWKDGRWIASTAGQVEMMKLAKMTYPGLLVGTSGMGDGRLIDSLVSVADYITIHFNNTALGDYADRIAEMRRAGKPVICNEDDKVGNAGATALLISVMNGCGWGFMHSRQNQTIPFRFEGYKDDTATYMAMRDATSPGYKIDRTALLQPSVIITYPNDGDTFRRGEVITVRFSCICPDKGKKYKITLVANDKEAGSTDSGRQQIRFNAESTGVTLLNLIVSDESGNEVLRSPKVDIIVK